MKGKFVKNNLALFSLLLISEEPKCGYELMCEIHFLTGSLISSGTMYPVLHSLLDDGLLHVQVATARRKRTKFRDRPKRILKVYSLTEKGEHKLRELRFELGGLVKFIEPYTKKVN